MMLTYKEYRNNFICISFTCKNIKLKGDKLGHDSQHDYNGNKKKILKRSARKAGERKIEAKRAPHFPY